MGRFHLNGNQLKRIALITMLIDHIGYLLIEAGALVFFSVYSREFFYFYYLDLVLRTIGRIAFPIYAFMVVEGFYHTRDWRKYARNLAILLVDEMYLRCRHNFGIIRRSGFRSAASEARPVDHGGGNTNEVYGYIF